MSGLVVVGIASVALAIVLGVALVIDHADPPHVVRQTAAAALVWLTIGVALITLGALQPPGP